MAYFGCMGKKRTSSVYPSLFGLLVLAQIGICLTSKVYVVYMGSKTGEEDPDELLRQNHQIIASVHGGSIEQARESHIYSYKHGFRGFAAKLTNDQASQISRMAGVVSVFPNCKRNLHTTHSWDFMGLLDDETMEVLGYSTKNQVNVIVGFIDTGIWPESPSFSDVGMPPVPAGWKGRCQPGEAFNSSTCNRKLIGARYYTSAYRAEEVGPASFMSARDSSGHGTHTSSIAAGRYIADMNYRGLASGGARGGAPTARVSVYKACWDSGCYDADLLAAFDDAIRDGVHIISVSLGPDAPQADYFTDAISVGSFHAYNRGILVVSSVGNLGRAGSATNVAPWLLTVAASSTDRDFVSGILMDDGRNFTGESLSLVGMKEPARIVSASEVNAGYFTPYQSSYCLESSLNKTKARGKVLVCRHAESSMESKLEKSIIVKEAGGLGMILIDEEDKNIAIPFTIPSAIVGTRTGARILSYINSTRNPMSRITAAKTVIGLQPAPRVAAFSSRGPNSLTPEILKPDVAAPGLNILAAWSPAKAKLEFNILSGTSMACPHVTGIATLVKAVHPSWSPSAIKSAIMTTATVLDKKSKPILVDPDYRRGNAFDFGSGFINPTRVLNPGLIYDSEPSDHIAFLCSIGYDEKALRQITGNDTTCDSNRKPPLGTATDLNYPSIAVPNLKGEVSVTRTVTNVGKPNSVYRARVSLPRGINVTVVPDRLVFTKSLQKLKFVVKFRVSAPKTGYSFGFLLWKNRRSRVFSPIVVRVASSNSGLLR